LTAIIGSVLLTLSWTTQPGPLYLYPSIENPFGIGGTPGTSWRWGGRVGWVVVWVSLIALLLSSLSRWMEAEGEERQQMKWFGCALLLLVFAYPFSPRGLLLFIVLALLPVAVGIAILKNGLYHLDIIFNRALVYGRCHAADQPAPCSLLRLLLRIPAILPCPTLSSRVLQRYRTRSGQGRTEQNYSTANGVEIRLFVGILLTDRDGVESVKAYS
jgi:hypothetical protein